MLTRCRNQKWNLRIGYSTSSWLCRANSAISGKNGLSAGGCARLLMSRLTSGEVNELTLAVVQEKPYCYSAPIDHGLHCLCAARNVRIAADARTGGTRIPNTVAACIPGMIRSSSSCQHIHASPLRPPARRARPRYRIYAWSVVRR